MEALAIVWLERLNGNKFFNFSSFPVATPVDLADVEAILGTRAGDVPWV